MPMLLPAALTAALLSSPVAVAPAQPASCSGNYELARIVRSVSPEYPAIAKLAGLTGTSRIRVDLSETGSVVGAWVVLSSGSGILDQAATQTAKSMVYAPEKRSCMASPGAYAVEVEFAD
jgi:periplasmic protein TonB